MRSHHKKVTMYFNQRAKNRNRNSIDDDEEESVDEVDDEDYFDSRLGYGTSPNDPCANVPMVEEIVCGHDSPPCESELYGVPGNFIILQDYP
jgi:hypothetical protein